MDTQDKLKNLPSVDESLKSAEAEAWLKNYPRRFVADGIRKAINSARKSILEHKDISTAHADLAPLMETHIKQLSTLSLRPLINATGVIMHTNLGRSALTERAVQNIAAVARGYSNLEYDLNTGKRGKRYSHIQHLLRTVTGAEDGIAVNNNAGAVMLCLSAMAKGREVIVSRGELVEIGGSFRVPEVMEQSGCILKEVGATNKTHLADYENAINDNTALILKVHQSNFTIKGFTENVSMAELVKLGKKHNLPVMYDMGSGCLIDLKPYGIHSEQSVPEVLKDNPSIVTISGDKLLGGPQAGIILGKSNIIANIQKHPMLRALRIDKLTLAALEATLMDCVDAELIVEKIPTLRMLLEPVENVKKRAKQLATLIKKSFKDIKAEVVKDITFSGGGALPTDEIDTFVVTIKSENLTANQMEERLRLSDNPVIARIKDDALILDLRTVRDDEIKPLAEAVASALD